MPILFSKKALKKLKTYPPKIQNRILVAVKNYPARAISNPFIAQKFHQCLGYALEA